MKRFLMALAACTAMFLMVSPGVTLAQHDDPDMEWEDTDDVATHSEEDDAASSKPLFERWGGATAIKGVVSEFASRVASDERLKGRLSGADMAQWRMQLVGQLTDAAGGMKYMGKSLKQMHMDMGFTEADLEVLAQDLNLALDWFEFKQQDKDKLLVKLQLKKADAPTGSI